MSAGQTRFAGLTTLEPGDPTSLDQGSFLSRNPVVTDHFLELGAKTHRHNNHPALANPLVAPTVTTAASGGQIAAGLSVTIGFTLLDVDNGETAVSPLAAITTSPGLSEPVSAPLASADYTGGTLRADTYYYAKTWIDAGGGETTPGPQVAVDRVLGYASGRVLLAGLTDGMALASAAGWKLYKAFAGGPFRYVTQGTADTFTDDGTVCADCVTEPPAVNTTGGQSTVTVTVGSALASASNGFRIYGGVGGLTDPALLGEYPTASGGIPIVYSAFSPTTGRPPRVSTSVGGAGLIDPDTELIDWPWKRPVATATALAAGAAGDVRMAKDTHRLYTPSGSAAVGSAGWTEIPGNITLALALTPATTARNVVQPTVDGVVALTLKRFSNTDTTGNIAEVQDETGVVLSYIDKVGYGRFQRVGIGGSTPTSSQALIVQPLSAANPAFVAKGAAAQSSDIQVTQDSTGGILSSISATGGGRFTGGIGINAVPLAGTEFYGGVTTVGDTATSGAQAIGLHLSALTWQPTNDIAKVRYGNLVQVVYDDALATGNMTSTYAGERLTTTIKNNAGRTYSNVYGLYSTITQDTAGTPGPITTMYGHRVGAPTVAGAVTTMLQKFIDAPTLSGSGSIGTLYGLEIANMTGIATTTYAIRTLGGLVQHEAGAAGTVALVAKVAASATADGFQVQNSSGTAMALFDASGNLRAPSFRGITATKTIITPNGDTGGLLIQTQADANKGIALRQNSGTQSASLVELQDSAGTTILTRFNKGGYFMTSLHAAPADADVATGEMALWFDQTNGASKLMVKAKQADGTVKTASLALA